MAARPHVPSAVSPFDAPASVERLLEHLRASAGATRVSVWVYEPAGALVVPFRVVARAGDDDGAACPRPALAMADSPFLATAIRSRRPVVARADGLRAPDRDLAQRGVGSAHAQPLLQGDVVVGVLTVEPAAAASPSLLRQLTPLLTSALAAAWAQRSEQRRTAHAEALLELIEAASATASVDELLSLACRQLTELDDVGRAGIFLLEQGTLVPAPPSPLLPLAEKALRTGHPASARDGSVVAVPLGRAPDVVGVLVLEGATEPALPGDVRRLAAAAALHLGALVELFRAREARSIRQLLEADPVSGVRQDRPRVPRPRTPADRS